MSSEHQIDQTQRLLSALTGESAEQTTQFADVRGALQKGRNDVVVELPWYPDGGTHQIILTRLVQDRVVFLNPLGHQGHSTGTTLEDGGIRRRVEPDGSESASVADLEALFVAGRARALLVKAGRPQKKGV